MIACYYVFRTHCDPNFRLTVCSLSLWPCAFIRHFFTYSSRSFSVPVSPPISSHAPLLLPSLGFWRHLASPLWIKRSYSVPSTKAPYTAALQCAPWSLAPPTGVTMTTLALHCPWTSTICFTSETRPTFSRGSARRPKSGNASSLAMEMVNAALCLNEW